MPVVSVWLIPTSGDEHDGLWLREPLVVVILCLARQQIARSPAVGDSTPSSV